MIKQHWNEFHENFPKSIHIERENLTDNEGNVITEKSWYYLHEKVMDYVTELLMDVDYEEN